MRISAVIVKCTPLTVLMPARTIDRYWQVVLRAVLTKYCVIAYDGEALRDIHSVHVLVADILRVAY